MYVATCSNTTHGQKGTAHHKKVAVSSVWKTNRVHLQWYQKTCQYISTHQPSTDSGSFSHTAGASCTQTYVDIILNFCFHAQNWNLAYAQKIQIPRRILIHPNSCETKCICMSPTLSPVPSLKQNNLNMIMSKSVSVFEPSFCVFFSFFFWLLTFKPEMSQ